jgi:threonine efflux protein
VSVAIQPGHVILSASLVYLVGVISPGPNFVLMVATAGRSRPAALATAVGFALAAMTWAGTTALGLALLLSRIGWAHAAIQVAGGSYLAYLGVRLLIRSRQTEATADVQGSSRMTNSLLRGFVTNITNPKSAAFFTSIFASIVPAAAPAWVLAALICSIGAVSLCWHSFLAVSLSSPVVRAGFQRWRSTIDAIFGIALVALGVRIATSR